MKVAKHAARLFDRARHAMAPEPLDKDGKPSRWRLWIRNYKTRKAIRAYSRHWQKMAPHQQLLVYVALMHQHPELRKAMRAALGVQPERDRSGNAGGTSPKPASGLILPSHMRQA